MPFADDDPEAAPEWLEPWKGPGLSMDSDGKIPVEASSFKCREGKRCDACGNMVPMAETMRGVRLGFTYSELCAACFALLREAVR